MVLTSIQWVLTIAFCVWLILAAVFNTRWVKQDRQKIKELEAIIKSRDVALLAVWDGLCNSTLSVEKCCAIIEKELEL